MDGSNCNNGLYKESGVRKKETGGSRGERKGQWGQNETVDQSSWASFSLLFLSLKHSLVNTEHSHTHALVPLLLLMMIMMILMQMLPLVCDERMQLPNAQLKHAQCSP